MPVHQFVHDSHLADRGMTNYWGYNTIGFFAPHNDYSSAGQNGQQVQEFKATVKALHEAGLEVILDVVYNHTAEGNQMGPTLSFRGIDNAAYYRLVDGDAKHYYDTTGTGNTLLMKHPHVLQLIMDSLRYWVTEMHVDGFRFDLASSLARQFHEVDRLSAFFDLVQQDPVISQVKLIAEPWDVGEGGYNVGGFPPLWTEWNGKYRDTVRDYWRGEDQTLGEFAARLTGSADLYEEDGRRPYASINFVTAHDGFTMHDLVSYNDKHNEANGEGGADGESHNSSWNCGVEGETDDLEVIALREQQKRNFLTTLFLVAGRADAAARRRARPHAGRQQQRLRAGQRDRLDRLGAREGLRGPVGLHRAAGEAAPGPPGLPPAPALPRPLGQGRHRRRHRLVHPRRRLDVAGGLGLRLRQVGRGVPQRRGDPRARPARRAGQGRAVLPAVQRPLRGHRLRPARPRRRSSAGRSRSTPRRRCSTTPTPAR